MSKVHHIIVHEIATDGMPPESKLPRIAFIYKHVITSGSPLRVPNDVWLSDVMEPPDGGPVEFTGVTHWVEFPCDIQELQH